jgi:hypothetical protein
MNIMMGTSKEVEETKKKRRKSTSSEMNRGTVEQAPLLPG